MLLERPGEIITRDELRNRLWQTDTFVGFDHGLNSAVLRLRELLGDSSDNPRFVETIPRRGYRFIRARRVASHIAIGLVLRPLRVEPKPRPNLVASRPLRRSSSPDGAW